MKETLETTLTGLYALNEADASKILILKKQISNIRKQIREREKQIQTNVKAMFSQPPGTVPVPIQKDNFGYGLISPNEKQCI